MSGQETRTLFLSPNVNILEIGSSLVLVREGEALRASNESANPAALREALLRLKRGSTAAGVASLVGVEEARLLLRELDAKALLLYDHPVTSADEIWAKQSGYLALHFPEPMAAQESLCQKRVAIIGVGGIGGITFQHLIAAGVSNFQLIDSDFVAPDNLNRQYIYNAESVGCSKIDIATAYAASVNPQVCVNGWERHVTSIVDLQVLDEALPDLLVLAADQPIGIIEEVVNNYCVPRRIPFITAGVGLERGFWGPLAVAGRTSCLSCSESQFNSLLSDEELMIRDAVRSINQYSFGPVNSIISSLLARDVILFLAGSDRLSSMGTRVTFNTQTLQSTSFTATPCNCWPT